MKFILYLLCSIFINDTFPLIHTIGGSRSFFSFSSWYAEPEDYNNKMIERLDYQSFMLHWMMSPTAYHIERHLEKLFEEGFFEESLSYQDICIFTFGEIDCRAHIQKQANLRGCSILIIIDEIVAAYERGLNLVKNKFLELDLRLVVLGMQPPLHEYHEALPTFGTFEERLKIIKLFNEQLKKMTKKNGYYFIDIYDVFAGPDGSLPLEQSDSPWNHVSLDFTYKVWDILMPLIMEFDNL